LELPKLTQSDYVVLKELRTNYPQSFYTNRTRFYIQEMYRYIDDHRVWRSSIMGETRVGKSEVASTVCLLYKQHYNKNVTSGLYSNLDVQKYMPIQPIEFTISYVMPNQSDYIYTLRETQKQKKMVFGQIWQIDEDKEKIGGMGSFSELLELQNLNNICAKFMQSEIWITPAKLLTRNCPYGLYVYKKDIENRVSWCLLYKIDMGTGGGATFAFLGWVKIPLHNDEAFRDAYNQKKNEWIEKEIQGGGDPRIMERKKAAQILSEDKFFRAKTESGKSFVLTKGQQHSIALDYVMQQKIHRFNEAELFMIIEEARLIVQKEQLKKEIEQRELHQKNALNVDGIEIVED